MSFTIRRAVTANAKPLVGLYSESGGGKTYSALLLAHGFCGGDMSKVCMIETESGRGEAWADDPLVGGYSIISIAENFSPKIYGEAIQTAERAKVQALIVDSGSHEWEGVGGVLAMAAENQADGKKGPIVWQQPKMQHAREFMLRLTQSPVPMIVLCLRAKFPMYEVKPADLERWEKAGRPGGKPPKVGDWARSWELEPKQSEDILYEMFVHGWLDKEKHAFHGTKYTINALREILIDGQPITSDTGKRLAEWAKRRAPMGTATAPSTPAQPAGTGTAPAGEQSSAQVAFISVDSVIDLRDKLKEAGIAESVFCAAAKIDKLELLPAKNSKGGDNYDGAVRWIQRESEKK